MMVSIIMTAYSSTQHKAHMAMAAIANITRYTNPSDYELLVYDGCPNFPIRDDYHVLKIDKMTKENPDLGYAASMNLGAKESKGQWLVFIQDDVFVWEGWLGPIWNLFLDGYEAVFPDQVPRSREEVLAAYNGTAKFGSKDAGLLAITRDAFERTGGWDEDLSLLVEKDFYRRMADAGVKETTTNKVMISHITQGTNDIIDPAVWHEKMSHDAKKLQKV